MTALFDFSRQRIHHPKTPLAMTAKTICILYVGGTIGMEQGASGYAPGIGLVERITAWTANHAHLASHRYRVEVCEPLIDSANAVPMDWSRLASLLWARRNSADGFVVLHGTDTLAYAASALSFLLQGFGKPVVVTGSQLPASMPESDAQDNALGAIACALEPGINEVTVYFGKRLLRGNRVRKRSSEAFDSFESPHWAALAEMGEQLVINRESLLDGSKQARAPATPKDFDQISIGLLKLYPGIGAGLIAAAARIHPDGLVLELYGAGAGPAANPAIVAALREAVAHGTPIVGVSQCFDGKVDLAIYEAGQALAACGVIDGGDLTAEAALAKLYYLRSVATPSGEIAQAMRNPIAGEVTP
jgi:L-asparaginase